MNRRLLLVILIAQIRFFCALADEPGRDISTWHYKESLLPELVRSVPKILKGQDKATGRFGPTNTIWLPADQTVIFPLAAAWAIKAPSNPWYRNEPLLKAIITGGDLLISAQEKDGQWEFRKKDNSTWGKHFDPWVYSRWVRAYSLISEAMPEGAKLRWQKALELGYSGIEKRELSRVHNIPSHHAMGLYVAGKALNHPDWCAKAATFLLRVADAQEPSGFWSEHVGPVVHYDSVYIDALGTYYGLSHNSSILPVLERAARFHRNFTYPDGTEIETVDERNPYLKSARLPNVGFSFSAEGRSYLREQLKRLHKQGLNESVDLVASLLLYGDEGPLASVPRSTSESSFVTSDGKASVFHRSSWCASVSAYTAPLSSSRWIQDRQNFVSLFHEKTGLILGGGNTKLQPLWSSFTIGDTALLQHRPGDPNPQFMEPFGLIHVPTSGRLETNGTTAHFTFGSQGCSAAVEILDSERACISYFISGVLEKTTVAHATFLPVLGKAWGTAAGRTGMLGNEAVKLSGSEIGGWFEHNGWRVELPKAASILWPVLPHNPYRKDGRAEPAEGRIVATLPFSEKVRTNSIVVSVRF